MELILISGALLVAGIAGIALIKNAFAIPLQERDTFVKKRDRATYNNIFLNKNRKEDLFSESIFFDPLMHNLSGINLIEIFVIILYSTMELILFLLLLPSQGEVILSYEQIFWLKIAYLLFYSGLLLTALSSIIAIIISKNPIPNKSTISSVNEFKERFRAQP